MHPELDEVVWFNDSFLLGLKKSLEDIGQVTNIELIMEVLGSLSEWSFDLSMELQGTLDDWTNLLLDGSLEFAEVLV